MHVVQLLLIAWKFSRDKNAIEVYIVRIALSSLGGACYIKVYASSARKAAAEQAQAGEHLYTAQLRNIWHPSVTTNMVAAKSSMERGPPVHMPTAPYEYRALTRRSSIRLVEIEPGLPGQPLKCSVRESDLESGQSFRALSYVWGEKRSQRSIFVKAADRSDPELAQLDVTPNLWDALQTLREAPPSAAPLTIWVDAICINQDDVEERSHQVAMMRETYAHASCVEVWLGHADQDTAYVVKLAQAIRQYVPDVHMQAVRRSNHMGAIKSMLGLQSLPSWPVDWIRAAEDLFASRTWFERVWVIQEVSAGSPVGVRIGDHRLSWDEVGLMAMWLREARWSATASAEGSEHLRNAVQMWQERFNRNERVPDLLDDARDFQATDARDKIHALLGFPCMARGAPIVPQYGKTTFLETYQRLVLSYISHTRKLDILSYVEHPAIVEDDPGLRLGGLQRWPGFPFSKLARADLLSHLRISVHGVLPDRNTFSVG